MRRPFVVTATGVGLGLALVLPLTRGQLVATAPAAAGVAAAPPAVPAAVTPPAAVPPVAGGPPRAGTPPTSPPQAGTPVTATGPSVATRYGPVQVQVVMTGGRISSATALQLPSGDRRSQQISDRSGPALGQEAVQAQSAQIDSISGATYTSRGYQRSLQAALDAARTRTPSGQA